MKIICVGVICKRPTKPTYQANQLAPHTDARHSPAYRNLSVVRREIYRSTYAAY